MKVGLAFLAGAASLPLLAFLLLVAGLLTGKIEVEHDEEPAPAPKRRHRRTRDKAAAAEG